MTLNRTVLIALLAGLACSANAQDDPSSSGEEIWDGAPIRDAMEQVSPDVRLFNDHVVTLANPFMMGRVPGSRGMELAKDYIQTYWEMDGLMPAFPDADGNAMSSYRDPFDLGGQWDVQKESLLAMVNDEAMAFEAEKDFVFTGLGSTGTSAGQAVFVGYSIEDGPDGWTSYDEDDDLTGKIAVMLRFEPIDEDGNSQWNEGGGWTGSAGLANKIAAAVERGAAGVVFINTPGANDPRIGRLPRFGNSGGAGVPVFFMSPEAGARLLEAGDPRERDIEELIEFANDGLGMLELDVAFAFTGKAERTPVIAENVGAMIPGKGDLADEYIIIGAHLDHLGMGYFGSRSGPGELHPGADDNASGSAALLLLGKQLAETFADDDDDRRTIVLMAFSAEESGLNGSRHYVNDPIVPLDQHTLMINWDMIGRIANERLTVAGANSADGLAEFIEPFLDDSGLEIVMPPNMSGASDHLPFYQSKIPVLFSIIADFHEDYHTPADVSWKINRVGAVKTVNMYHDIVVAIATSSNDFEFNSAGGGSDAGRRTGDIKVRFGVMPGSYDENNEGVLIGGIADDGPAAKAGVLAGDRLVRWDGQKVTGVEHWMQMLSSHEPGDEIKIGVIRDDKEMTLDVVLEGK